MAQPALRKKIRSLRKVPVTKTPNRERGKVHFESERGIISVRLVNEKGHLKGVFETPEQDILTIRYDKIANNYTAYVNDNSIGVVEDNGDYRKVQTGYRGIGIASELFDLLERSYGRWPDNFQKDKQPRLVFATKKADTLAFFLSKGYRGRTDEDRDFIRQFGKERKTDTDLDRQIWIIKSVKGTQFDNPNKWHRIKIVGRDGKIKWLTLRVMPVKEEKK